jgi:adenylosuccinate lyase
MMVETYETFSRLNKTLKQLSINEDRLAQNLEFVRRNPSEAMTAILRGAGFVHPVYGVGHDFVKEVGKTALKEGRPLLGVAMEDLLFANLVDSLSENKKRILAGQLELYTGSAYQRAESNIAFARTVANRYGGR